MAIHSQPLLPSYDADADAGSTTSSSSRGPRSAAGSADARWLRHSSCGDVLGDGDGSGSGRHRRGLVAKDAGQPAYVSFEDLLGTAASQLQQEAAEPRATISDPLVRTASRLYYSAPEAAQPPRQRQRSPGPLGTRRGSAMHAVVKKYVQPLLGFLARICCCDL